MTKINRQWRLTSRPVGLVKDSDFEWREEPLPTLKEGEVLVKNIYLSLDPANRIWMNEQDSYMPAVGIGEVMRGIALGIVEESQDSNFQKGDLVQAMTGWQDYAALDGKTLTVIPKGLPIPLTAYLGLFGHIGYTAYFGLLDIANPQPGETLVVSAAAGAVGSLVGQIGKIKGCYVVGIAGSDEKCQWIKEELGFDAVINYKTENVFNRLKELCPKGIDVYFDNVGGQILDAVLAQINKFARISLCGLISGYNERPAPGPYYFPNLLVKSAKVQGFIVIDYLNRAQEANNDLGKWFISGKLKYKVDVVEGLEKAPQAINKLFDGSNQGKLLVKVSEEPS